MDFASLIQLFATANQLYLEVDHQTEQLLKIEYRTEQDSKSE